jgi:hypothetical protein
MPTDTSAGSFLSKQAAADIITKSGPIYVDTSRDVGDV